MNSRFPSPCAMLLPALILLLLTGCAQTPNAEPPPTARKPKPAPLPQAVLQIDSKPSTATLSRGQQWLQNTDKLLYDAMPK